MSKFNRVPITRSHHSWGITTGMRMEHYARCRRCGMVPSRLAPVPKGRCDG